MATPTERAPKRQRTSHSAAYHDAVPIGNDDDFSTVYYREGRNRRQGKD